MRRKSDGVLHPETEINSECSANTVATLPKMSQGPSTNLLASGGPACIGDTYAVKQWLECTW